MSDQHSTYGTQIIVSTERDATYVLDEILGNTTELPILEHATDTHGQMLLTFALFDLAGRRLSPRIAKLPERQLWRPHEPARYQRWPLAGPLLSQRAQTETIAEHWDDLLRIGGSLLGGYVSAALLVSRLRAGSRQHPLAKALLEYGKLLRTAHALRWFTDQAFRRRIGRQLSSETHLRDRQDPQPHQAPAAPHPLTRISSSTRFGFDAVTQMTRRSNDKRQHALAGGGTSSSEACAAWSGARAAGGLVCYRPRRASSDDLSCSGL